MEWRLRWAAHVMEWRLRWAAHVMEWIQQELLKNYLNGNRVHKEQWEDQE
jgi:hypothetical protein